MKIPALIWIYHTEVWFELLPLLKGKNVIPHIGLCNLENSGDIIDSVSENFNEFKVNYYENIGSDIGPFLHQLLSVDSPVFIKIHSKRDKLWRQTLTECLLLNLEANIKTILSENTTMPWGKTTPNDIGMLASRDCIVSNSEYTNTDNIIHLCDILSIDYQKVKNTRYVSGTMFISKTDLFRKYFNNTSVPQILGLLEQGEVKDTVTGTFTHALERIFGYIVTIEGLRIKSL